MGSLRAFPHEVAMRKSITFFLLAFSLSACLAYAQEPLKLQDSAPDRYIVQQGDTLWGIATKFLKDPWRWQDIWRLNQEQISDPQRIYPGTVIVLDRKATPPKLTITETVKLSPQVRVEPVAAEAIASIPANVIEPFLSQPLVIEENGLEKAPRIVGTEESRVNIGAGGVAYALGIGQSGEPLWQVFRPGRPLVDPDGGKTLGYEATYLGMARVTLQGEPATLRIVTAKQEISQGDRLIPAGPAVINRYAPHPPASFLKGRIIALYTGLTTGEGGKDSIVSINKGRRDGLEMGNVLAILRAGASIPDPQSTLAPDRAPSIRLPDERYGLAFVFRVFDSVSYALIMESARPVAPGDIVQSP